MQNKGSFLRSALTLIVLFLVFALLLTGLNTWAGPIIEQGEASQAVGPLMEVLPGAQGFDLIYSNDGSAGSELVDIPESVESIYSETSGLGYAMLLTTSQGYTKQPMEIALGIDAEGKIAGAQVLVYPETKDMGVDTYPQTYVGQDSTLADVSLVAGVTYSSKAFHDAVLDAFSALTANELVTAGVKGDDQILTELIATVFPGIMNSEGAMQGEETDTGIDGVTAAYKAPNGAGFAFIANVDGAGVLAIANTSGSVCVYDVDGNVVTDSYAEFAETAAAYARDNGDLYTDDDISKLGAYYSKEAEYAVLGLDGVYNTVTAAYTVTENGETLYAFVSRPYGYSNMPMAVYYVLNADGEIVMMNAKEFILEKEYFSKYTLDAPSYKEGFVGLTGETMTDDVAFISGATVTTNAVKAATHDVFDAFATLKGNGGLGNE